MAVTGWGVVPPKATPEAQMLPYEPPQPGQQRSRMRAAAPLSEKTIALLPRRAEHYRRAPLLPDRLAATLRAPGSLCARNERTGGARRRGRRDSLSPPFCARQGETSPPTPQLPGHLREFHALAQQPIGSPQLANDLLRRVTSPRHPRAPLSHSTGPMKLSHASDRFQRVGPA